MTSLGKLPHTARGFAPLGESLSVEEWKSITYIGFHGEMPWKVESHGWACLARADLDAGELCRIQMS